MRCFIAVEIPEYIRKEILKVQNQLPEFKGKITEFENLHLTLKFIGEIDEDKVKEIKKRLREIKFKPFETEIDSIGFFSKDAIRIIWLHLKNCEKLQEEIDEKLEGLFEKEKRFMGHLTIARVKSVDNRRKFIEGLQKMKIPPIHFKIDSFNLKQSVLTAEKPIYSNIEKFNLKYK